MNPREDIPLMDMAAEWQPPSAATWEVWRQAHRAASREALLKALPLEALQDRPATDT